VPNPCPALRLEHSSASRICDRWSPLSGASAARGRCAAERSAELRVELPIELPPRPCRRRARSRRSRRPSRLVRDPLSSLSSPTSRARPTRVTRSSGRPTFVATGQAAWSLVLSPDVANDDDRPSRSTVHPDCLAASSSVDRCSPNSNPSGNVTSNGSDPGGCLALAYPASVLWARVHLRTAHASSSAGTCGSSAGMWRQRSSMPRSGRTVSSANLA
jgi:hypothetical protein